MTPMFPDSSACSSPVDKDGSISLSLHCLLRIKDITIEYKYPLPLINSTFGPLHQATIFSRLNLRNVYHLVHIRKKEGRMSGRWPSRCPWATSSTWSCPGLTSAPTVFHNFIKDICCDMLNWYVFVYLDDFLIFSRSQEEHVQHWLVL